MLRFGSGAVVALIAVVMLVLVAGPPGAPLATTDRASNVVLSDTGLSSAPLKRHAFKTPAFSVYAPEDWRMLTCSELKTLAETRGRNVEKAGQIIGVIVSPRGERGRGMVVFANAKPKGKPLKKLKAFEFGVSWARMISSTGREANVTTPPYAHDLGGLDAASMVMQATTRKGAEVDLGITMIDLPGRPIMALLVTRTTEQRGEAEAVLASFHRTR